MADTLETLEIEVKHNTTGAESAINRLADSVRGLQQALAPTLKDMREFASLLSKVGGKVNGAMPKSKSTGSPLSAELQEQIANAGKLEVEVHKAAEAGLKMEEAFQSGDESAAWKAREQELGAIARAAKEAQKPLAQTGKSLESVGKSASKSLKPLANFISSLKRIAFYRFIRTIIKAITQAFTEGLQNAYAFSDAIATEGHRFSEALDSMSTAGNTMKNQLGSAFIALLAAIAPIVNQIIALIVKLADFISQIFSAFTGSTYLKATDMPTKWADAAKGAAKAAKEWKNQLLAFDEINRLEEPSDSGGGGSGSGADPFSMFQDTPINDRIKAIVDTIKAHLNDLEMFAGGALLGLGLVLLFTGANIPLGLGLIAAGAVVLAKKLTENWGKITENVENALSAVETVASGLLVGIGLALALSGANIPLGLGLIAGGITLGAAAMLNWDEIPNRIKAVIAGIMIAVGVAALAIGAVLAFSGANIPLGIGLIAVGALALGSVALVGWEYIPEKIRSVLSTLMTIVGGFLVAIGLLLVLTGAGIPLGLGMILAGGGLLAASLPFSGQEIINAVKSVLNALTSMFWGFINWCIDGVKSFIEWIKSALEGIATLRSRAQAAREETAARFGVVDFGGYAADGGYFESGQMFIARESGAGAELVGNIGGRTGVASNDDILNGIRQGVFEAVSAAMNGGGQAVDVKVYLDSRQIKTGQERLNRAMGVSG